MSNNHPYTQVPEPEEMNCDAIDSLLQRQGSYGATLNSTISSHVLLNPIMTSPRSQEEKPYRLPSLSDLLLYQPIEQPRQHHSHRNSQASILYSPSEDDTIISSYQKANTTVKKLIPPLSSSSSYSSLHSVASISSPSTTNLLSRAATLHRRRGRPRKSINEFKMIEHHGEEAITNKPRWQETEKLELLEAIVKEKQLDDMTSIRWDRISLVVGRAKKSCKDQWRRELLPNLLGSFRRNQTKKKK